VLRAKSADMASLTGQARLFGKGGNGLRAIAWQSDRRQRQTDRKN
jgi:hypothetical protein